MLLTVPVILFGLTHMRRAWRRPNRYAVRAGIALFSIALVLLFTGLMLTRFDFFEINDPLVRRAAYWVHIVSPLAVAWLSLDDRDDDPGRFLHYLAAALNQADPALGAGPALGACRRSLCSRDAGAARQYPDQRCTGTEGEIPALACGARRQRHHPGQSPDDRRGVRGMSRRDRGTARAQCPPLQFFQ